MFITAELTGGSRIQRWSIMLAIATVNVAIGAGLLLGATRIIRFGWMG